MEVQLTDFANAAFTVFASLLSRVILFFDLNLYIPISKVRCAAVPLSQLRTPPVDACAMRLRRRWMQTWPPHTIATPCCASSSTSASTSCRWRVSAAVVQASEQLHTH